MKAHRKMSKAMGTALLSVLMVLVNIAGAYANSDPIRIVTLPFYSEEGRDVNDGDSATLHYRRMMRFINNQLNRHDFEVINPFAKDAAEREYNRIQEIAREDSSLAVLELTKKYGVDAVYLTWLKVKVKKTDDGYCKASARLDGEGFDSAAHDLGVGVSKTFKVTRRDCDDSIAEVEKEVGDLVGRTLTAWSGKQRSNVVVGSAATAPAAAVAEGGQSGGALAKSIRKNQKYLSIQLNGATDYPIVEVFGKVVKTARGVEYAKNYGQRIIPDNPQACFAKWRVTIDDTDAFVLQANIMKMINEISDNGGELVLAGVPYRYTAEEIDLLKGVRPGDATSLEVQFVVDRELVRDRDMSGRHDAYQARNSDAPKFD